MIRPDNNGTRKRVTAAMSYLTRDSKLFGRPCVRLKNLISTEQSRSIAFATSEKRHQYNRNMDPVCAVGAKNSPRYRLRQVASGSKKGLAHIVLWGEAGRD